MISPKEDRHSQPQFTALPGAEPRLQVQDGRACPPRQAAGVLGRAAFWPQPGFREQNTSVSVVQGKMQVEKILILTGIPFLACSLGLLSKTLQNYSELSLRIRTDKQKATKISDFCVLWTTASLEVQ